MYSEGGENVLLHNIAKYITQARMIPQSKTFIPDCEAGKSLLIESTVSVSEIYDAQCC